MKSFAGDGRKEDCARVLDASVWKLPCLTARSARRRNNCRLSLTLAEEMPSPRVKRPEVRAGQGGFDSRPWARCPCAYMH